MTNGDKTKIRAFKKRFDLINLHGGQCKVCGYNKCISSLCFHHKDPQSKKFNLNAYGVNGHPWAQVLEEASKCDLLCSNCHAECHSTSRVKSRRHTKNIDKKLKLIDINGGGCTICGYSKYYGALAFHHRDPSDKKFSIGLNYNLGWDNLLKEVDKCDLLCTNCHQELHYLDFNSPTQDDIDKYFNRPKKEPKYTHRCELCDIIFHNNFKVAKFCSRKCLYKNSTSVLPINITFLDILEESKTLNYKQIAEKYHLNECKVSNFIKSKGADDRILHPLTK